MPNTERAFELLDDDRYDEDPPYCLWCGAVVRATSDAYCSSTCEAAAQSENDIDEMETAR